MRTPIKQTAERSEAMAGGPPVFSSAENVPLPSGGVGAMLATGKPVETLPEAKAHWLGRRGK